MKIALVDDERQFCHHLKALIQKMELPGGQPHITIIENGEQLLACYEPEPAPFDMILLDLEMPVRNGLEAATEIRRRYDSTVVIMVVTKHKGLALQASRFQPLYYCWKPQVSGAMFREDFLSAYEVARNHRRHGFVVEYQGSGRFFLHEDIYYIEKTKKGPVAFHTNKGLFYDHRPLREIMKTLGALTKGKFYQVHRSFVVNLENVVEVNVRQFYLVTANGEQIPVSRLEVKEAYRAWLGLYKQ